MATYFLDSSALVKRYVQEPGSGWVSGLFGTPRIEEVLISAITPVEIASAISRRARGQSISAAEATVALAALRSHLRLDYRAIALDPGVVTRAMALAESRGLRGYDAVQLATALHVIAMAPAQAGALTFVSSDLTLNAAASGEGLAVVNPESQP